MADRAHLDILEESVVAWNSWRGRFPSIEPNLSRATLSEANLSGANLFKANLTRANLTRATLRRANLRGATLRGAGLSEADLSDADLTSSVLVKTNLTGATLTGCSIYGISAWSLKLEGAIQQNLNVSDEREPAIMVDNLEVAQFVYLLLNNEKIRDVIDTIGEKGVLILGRFTEERKAVLDAIRDRLRELGFVPMMFDFERPTQRDFSETIKTLAGLSRFIIADITNPKSSPLELQATMPNYMIQFVPIIHEDEEPFAMFRDLQQKYGEWVLDVLEYDSAANLLGVLDKAVVKPALEKSDQLLLEKTEAIRTRHIRDYQ
jgi:Pentapeptide repeats (8 copies)